MTYQDTFMDYNNQAIDLDILQEQLPPYGIRSDIRKMYLYCIVGISIQFWMPIMNYYKHQPISVPCTIVETFASISIIFFTFKGIQKMKKSTNRKL